MLCYLLEGYCEKCDILVVLGMCFVKKFIELKIFVIIVGMFFGVLFGFVKEVLGCGVIMVGILIIMGDGGMINEECGYFEKLVYQYLFSCYGMNFDDLCCVDVIEIVVG